MILCGKCKEYHNSVDEVRACHQQPIPTQPAAPTGTVTDRLAQARVALPNLPKASYALRGSDGVVKFYQVDKPKQGKWKGYTFLKVQAGDDLWPIKNMGEQIRILEKISEDPEAAAALYGHELGKCGICHRTLTNPESIERGIGPVCAGKAGW